jgi:hypothetical protein
VPDTGISGVTMRLAKIILGALMVIAVCSVASATLDAKVYTLCERNLSMNLTPNFHIIPAQGASSANGLFMQGYTITGTGSKGLAMLATMDIYDETMKLYEREAFSQMFTGAMSSLMSYSSDTETDNVIGNWSTLDKNGENVTVDTLDTKGSLFSMYGKRMDSAFWNIGGDNYAYLISSFDKNVTSQMINSLEIN